ncbi:MAG: hypothetical protein HC877_18830 [Thioploca sp.]|nr:hypothetical protein [Thioploca sp.]
MKAIFGVFYESWKKFDNKADGEVLNPVNKISFSNRDSVRLGIPPGDYYKINIVDDCVYYYKIEKENKE